MEKYQTKGTCSREIRFETDGDVIKSVSFVGGCPGNALGLASLLQGMKIDDAIERLSGIRCGFKSTSCPDQLAQALKQYKSKQL